MSRATAAGVRALATGQIERWVETDASAPSFARVYVLGHARARDRGRGCGRRRSPAPARSISHRSAASCLGFGKVAPRRRRPDPGDAAGAEDRRDQGAPACPTQPRPNCGLVDGIPCTSVARTVVDLAGTYGEEELRETVERAATAGRARPRGDRGDARHRAAAARRALPAPRARGLAAGRRDGEARDGAQPLRGEAPAAGRRGRTAAARRSTPRSAPRSGSSRSTSSGPPSASSSRPTAVATTRIEVAFERDRRRDRELMAAGYDVLRVTWREAERETEAVFARPR